MENQPEFAGASQSQLSSNGATGMLFEATVVQEKPVELAPPAASQQPAAHWRELLAIAILIVLCDLTIYRGYGFAGYALLFVGAPILIWLGKAETKRKLVASVVAAMLVALAVRMIWYGSSLLVTCGFALVIAFAMCLAGQLPFVVETASFASRIIAAGFHGLNHYGRTLNRVGFPFARMPWLNVVLPAVAFVAFGMIFILANPDLLASFSKSLERFLSQMEQWLVHFSPLEFVFWIAVLWIGVGLLRPLAGRSSSDYADSTATTDELPATPAHLYVAFRNTLLTVIVLFAVYLVFEFATLWFREFPEGFYYAGYAHEGAAWLTVALAMSTVVLSFIFRGKVLQDPRLPGLRTLAWIWSFQNFILALAVYNRMLIYINFNGMTRMRTVGIFGITTVVVGFIFVLWKITHNRSFVWLFRRHLLTLAVAVYLFALTPVDMIVHTYNVHRILAGDLAPVVQITEHPVNTEGILVLAPLLSCEDETIREGIRAMLAEREERAAALAMRRKTNGWTTYQVADQRLLNRLSRDCAQWAEFRDNQKRDAALTRFKEYAYQWY